VFNTCHQIRLITATKSNNNYYWAYNRGKPVASKKIEKELGATWSAIINKTACSRTDLHYNN